MVFLGLMNFPDYFADAEADFDEADIIIFSAAYDKTTSFRHGADKAPEQIREAGWNFETFNLRTAVDLKDFKFHDYGDLNVKNDSPYVMVEKVKNFTLKVLQKNKFPIMIGGEHSVTAGAIQAFPDDIAVVSLDAHMDFRDQYENEKFNHACVIRRVADHIGAENVAVIGVRSAEKEEYDEAKKQGLFFIDSFTIQDIGIEKALNQTLNHLKNNKIYLTLDIDVLDPCFAPGTSTPEPFGLSSFDVLKCIEILSTKLVGFDVVEVCPSYDKGETAILAAKYVRYVIEKINS